VLCSRVWAKSIALVLLCFASLPLRAIDPNVPIDQADAIPLIYANTWGFTLALDGSGFYNEIAADVLGKIPGAEKYSVTEASLYRIMPFRRAQMMFFNRDDSCLYPSSIVSLATANQLEDLGAYIESTGLFAARAHLFVRPGDTPPGKLDGLHGKSIAFPHGSVVGKLLDGYGARLISVNDEIDRAEMLLSGRVDIISGMLPDTALIFKQLQSEMPSYDPSLVVIEAPVTFVCHNNERNRRFIQNVNAALDALSSDPEYLDRLAKAKIVEGVLGNIDVRDAAQDGPDKSSSGTDDRKKGSEKSKKNRSGRRLPMHANP